MKNKIIAILITLLIIGGIISSTVNETARVIAGCLMLVSLATILGFCIYQLVKIVSGEED